MNTRHFIAIVWALLIFLTFSHSKSSGKTASSLLSINTLVNAPSLRCVTVNASGSITLTWVQSADSLNGFTKYEIYRATSLSGPYTLVNAVNNIAVNTYTDASINAQTSGPYFYYVTANYSFGGGTTYQALDTLANIKLTVTNPGTNGLQLNWTTQRNPFLPSSTGQYKIYRQFPANTGPWTLIATTTGTSYFDQVNVCNRFVNYYIEIDDQSGCTSASNTGTSLFQDQSSPNMPSLDSVSVNLALGFPVLGWNASTSTDVIGYIIYYFDGAALTTIDTVYANTTFTDTSTAHPLPVDGSQYYCIAAMDSCENVSLITSFQRTIYLVQQLDKCNGKNVLSWTKYINWPGGVGSYEIYANVNGGSFSLAGTVSSGDTSFEHTGLIKGNTYCYYIKAISANGKTATSNQACVYATVPIPPQYIYLTHASVTSKNEIEIKAFTDTNADVIKYKLSKASDLEPDFAFLTDIPFSTNPFVSYTDTDVLPDSISYQYKLTVIDSCGEENIQSNIGKSIVLKVTPYVNLINTLEWTEYTLFDGGVDRYDIYRSIDGKTGPTYISSVPGNMFYYEDDVTAFTKTKGNFCYYVVAREGAGNLHGIADSSLSNFACVFQEPTLYIPNAFKPSSEFNSKFKPVCVYVDEKDYLFQIYDRWGKLVFSSVKIDEAWDGGGMEGGIYIYHVSYIDLNGIPHEKRGNVMLLK